MFELLKKELAEFNAWQNELFPHTEITHLLTQRSQFYDQFIIKIWHYLALEKIENITLLAVGGYGREEMFPLSDIDLLILSNQPFSPKTLHSLNQFISILWDLKLNIGVNFRTIDECILYGKADISIATNMLESRFIFGEKLFYSDLIHRIYQDDFWQIDDYYQAKLLEKTQRYQRYHNTSYNLEPDIKHSPGGLRDIHLMLWIMRRYYKLNTLEALHSANILYPQEFEQLTQAKNFIFRMRFALHLQLKKYDNRIRIDRQLQLSQKLGYPNEGNRSVEKMMKSYFQATQIISQLSQLILNNFKESILTPHLNQQTEQFIQLNQYFYLKNNIIYCNDTRCFIHSPHTIFDLFFYLTHYQNATIHANTLRLLRISLSTFNSPLCNIPMVRKKFIAILDQPNMVKRAIIPMHQLGILNVYFTQWKDISGLMQFDRFHIYTVDEHIIKVMSTLEQFLEEKNDLFLFYAKLFTHFKNKKIVYLAALFHDISKGKNGDHALLGSLEIYQFAKLHDFDEKDATQMAWLVKEHLTMSITAQRRDIHNPKTIQQFAELVVDKDHLSALTCLTVADIYATNPTLWNDWKNLLFTQLFEFTIQQLSLQRGEVINYKSLAIYHKIQALEYLKNILSNHQLEKLNDFWEKCPINYFVRNSAKQLIWHIKGLLSYHSIPMVLISNHYAKGQTEIFIYAKDKPYLFYIISKILSRKKINIHNAQISTKNQFIFDSFIISETNGNPLNKLRREELRNLLVETLSQDKLTFTSELKQISPSRLLDHQTKVNFLTTSTSEYTEFELFTLDREGLLAQISYIFNQMNINLMEAKITTIGKYAEDFFIISAQNNRTLNENEKAILKNKLIEILDQ